MIYIYFTPLFHIYYVVNIFFQISDAPKHFHRAMVEANTCLEEEEEKIHCFHWFQQSPYWAHSEAILLALLSDKDQYMRIWAVQKINEIRQNTDESVSEYFKDGVRTWKKVKLLTPLPEHYKDMIGKFDDTLELGNFAILLSFD